MPYRKSNRQLPANYWSREADVEQEPATNPDDSADLGRFVVLGSGTINVVVIEGLIPIDSVYDTSKAALPKSNFTPAIEPL